MAGTCVWKRDNAVTTRLHGCSTEGCNGRPRVSLTILGWPSDERYCLGCEKTMRAAWRGAHDDGDQAVAA